MDIIDRIRATIRHPLAESSEKVYREAYNKDCGTLIEKIDFLEKWACQYQAQLISADCTIEKLTKENEQLKSLWKVQNKGS